VHARSQLDRGRWDDAVDSAEPVLRNPRSSPVTRVVALSVLGLVRARRGDPGVWDALDEAWELALPTGELQRIEPTAFARAEAAWLEGRAAVVEEATGAALELAAGRGAWWIVGELLGWRRRAGVVATVPGDVPEPWRSQLAGDWRRAAALWTKLDAPYEAALALGEADDDEALRLGLGSLQDLGAAPAAAILARRMRERGMRGIARGPRQTTKENPVGLTRRELEVLGLLADGLRNREIAERLVLAPKTVDHHVTAILRKLDSPTRGQAAAAARRLGIL
jgi:DNA-binding CsgD family transcriptional regulator